MLFEVNSRFAEESSFMRKSIRRCALEGFAAIGLCAALSLLGCSGSNENERENARTATPGIPAENPNESFGDRRERTRGQSKQLEKIETRTRRRPPRQEPAASKKTRSHWKGLLDSPCLNCTFHGPIWFEPDC